LEKNKNFSKITKKIGVIIFTTTFVITCLGLATACKSEPAVVNETDSLETQEKTTQNTTHEPIVVKNGDELEISVDAGEVGLTVTAYVSELDSTKTDPIILNQEQEGIYKGRVTISLGNSATNGIKTITINATDNWGNVGTSTIEIELKNQALVLDSQLPNDNFDDTVLDVSKWISENSSGGVVKQNERLIVSKNSDPEYSFARILSTWEFVGDFDFQVDFQIGEGWSHDNVAGAHLGVHIEGHGYQIVQSNDDELSAWSSSGLFTYKAIPPNVLSGKFRLVRDGTTLAILYDIGSGWQELTSETVPSSPAQVYLGIGSINESQAFTCYFDNFHINSGVTTYQHDS